MTRASINAALMSTTSHTILHIFMPPMSLQFIRNVVAMCDRNIVGIIQLRELLDARKAQAMAGEGVEEGRNLG